MIQQINIRKTVQEKNPFLAYIPFLVQWMKTIVHEKEINEFLLRYGHLQGIEFAKSMLEFLNVQVEVKGNYPPLDGRYIFVSNHPLGGLDGIIFMCVISAAFPNIKFPVNDILYAIENLREFFLPINKHGDQDSNAVEEINQAYASIDKQMLMFPAGLVSRRMDNGDIIDLPWQTHFIKKAVKFERDIVPVHISGNNSDWFYTVANMRKQARIKSNIEMMLLPRELFLQTNKIIEITIGRPISYKDFKKIPGKSSAKSSEFWADYVRKQVYELTL